MFVAQINCIFYYYVVVALVFFFVLLFNLSIFFILLHRGFAHFIFFLTIRNVVTVLYSAVWCMCMCTYVCVRAHYQNWWQRDSIRRVHQYWLICQLDSLATFHKCAQQFLFYFHHHLHLTATLIVFFPFTLSHLLLLWLPLPRYFYLLCVCVFLFFLFVSFARSVTTLPDD